MSETLNTLEEIAINLPSETNEEVKAKESALKKIDAAKQAIASARTISLNKISYTIGVRRPLVPFYKKYKVVGHKELEDGRLRLTLPDTSVIVIPGILKKFIKIFEDYALASAELQKLTQGQGEKHGETSS